MSTNLRSTSCKSVAQTTTQSLEAPTRSSSSTQPSQDGCRCDRQLWYEIKEEFNENRRKIEDYQKLKKGDADHPPNPVIEYLNKDAFPLLDNALIEMFEQMTVQECFTERENSFNGLNFIAEYMWNMNARYPERKSGWTSIYKIVWPDPRSQTPTDITSQSEQLSAEESQSTSDISKPKSLPASQAPSQLWFGSTSETLIQPDNSGTESENSLRRPSNL